MNMTDVIVPKSDQINADDLIGRDMTITIRDVQIRGGQEQPVSILFEGSDKAFRPCKSMSRVLVYCWGPDAKQYIGRSLTLYRDPNVKWGGMAVGGIRISHASHIDGAKTMVLAESRANRKPYTVKPLVGAPTGGLSKADALADIEGAETLDDLAIIWRRKAMAPYREELQGDLDRRKTELGGGQQQEEGRPDADHGEQFTADTIIDFINQKTRRTDLDALMRSHADAIASFSDEERGRIGEAFDAKVKSWNADA